MRSVGAGGPPVLTAALCASCCTGNPLYLHQLRKIKSLQITCRRLCAYMVLADHVLALTLQLQPLTTSNQAASTTLCGAVTASLNKWNAAHPPLHPWHPSRGFGRGSSSCSRLPQQVSGSPVVGCVRPWCLPAWPAPAAVSGTAGEQPWGSRQPPAAPGWGAAPEHRS